MSTFFLQGTSLRARITHAFPQREGFCPAHLCLRCLLPPAQNKQRHATHRGPVTLETRELTRLPQKSNNSVELGPKHVREQRLRAVLRTHCFPSGRFSRGKRRARNAHVILYVVSSFPSPPLLSCPISVSPCSPLSTDAFRVFHISSHNVHLLSLLLSSHLISSGIKSCFSASLTATSTASAPLRRPASKSRRNSTLSWRDASCGSAVHLAAGKIWSFTKKKKGTDGLCGKLEHTWKNHDTFQSNSNVLGCCGDICGNCAHIALSTVTFEVPLWSSNRNWTHNQYRGQNRAHSFVRFV